MDFSSMLVYNYISVFYLLALLVCSFGLCSVEAHPLPILRKGNSEPNTPLQKLFKKNQKNFLVKIIHNCLFEYILSIN